MDIETQCEVIQYPIKEKTFKKKKQTKNGLILCCGIWINTEKWSKDFRYVDKAPILRTYRTFLSSWSNLTGNKLAVPKTLAEIFSELYTST